MHHLQQFATHPTNNTKGEAEAPPFTTS